MLTLCYVGKENLLPTTMEETSMDSSWETPDLISIASSYVVGDKNAAKVLECLSSIAALYGEQIILLQYLPHMGELIALCKRRLTVNLEGGLISCLALLKHLIPYLSDATLMDQLHVSTEIFFFSFRNCRSNISISVKYFSRTSF